MLSAQAYSFRQQARLAISLSWIGGYSNVVTLLCFGALVAHMTGNTTWFAMRGAERAWEQAAFFGLIIVSFVVGGAASALATETARRRGARSKYIVPMAIEATILAVFGVAVAMKYDVSAASRLIDAGSSAPAVPTLEKHIPWIACVAAFAMGLQNATITMISGAVVRTTHLTGVLTDIGIVGVQYLLYLHDRKLGRSWQRSGRLARISARHPTALRFLLLASIFGSFIFGVVAGTLVYIYAPRVVFFPPVVFLVWIIFVDWWTPIADVKEIDLLSDPELRSAGILVHELLPRTVGIYRLSPNRHGRRSRAPNFQFWVDVLPAHWKVVILALTPAIHFDTNSAMDLEQAINKLRRNGRRLILCGVSPTQYSKLDKLGLMEKVGWENMCPDLEFAISRAVEITQLPSNGK